MNPDKIKAYLDEMRLWHEDHRLNCRDANMHRDALEYIKKLEAVAEAANNLIVYACPQKSSWLDDLDSALDKLDTLAALENDK